MQKPVALIFGGTGGIGKAVASTFLCDGYRVAITSRSRIKGESIVQNLIGSHGGNGSIVGTSGNVGQTVYSASKAGLIGLTRSLAKEVATRNIRVNLVSPGFIQTEMTKAIEMDNSGQLSVPLKRFGQPEEVAELVKFLASATYITGQVINVDGGLHLS